MPNLPSAHLGKRSASWRRQALVGEALGGRLAIGDQRSLTVPLAVAGWLSKRMLTRTLVARRENVPGHRLTAAVARVTTMRRDIALAPWRSFTWATQRPEQRTVASFSALPRRAARLRIVTRGVKRSRVAAG